MADRGVVMKMNEKDERLLNLLQKPDACVPRVTRIAHRLGMPTSTVHAKLRRYREAGLVKGYHAVIDPQKANWDFVAFILGQVSFEDEKHVDDIGERLKRIPQLQEVYFVTGEWDYLVKVRVRNKEEYYETMKRVAKIFGIRAKGMICPREVKSTDAIPFRPPGPG